MRPKMSPELSRMLAEYRKEVADWAKKHPLEYTTYLMDTDVVQEWSREGKTFKFSSTEMSRRKPLTGTWQTTYDPESNWLFVEKISD
jgi:hypothetical protein